MENEIKNSLDDTTNSPDGQSIESLPSGWQQHVQELRNENKSRRLKEKELEMQLQELVQFKSEFEKIKIEQEKKQKADKMKAGEYEELLKQQNDEFEKLKAEYEQASKIAKLYQTEKETAFKQELEKLQDEEIKAEFEKLGINSLGALKAYNAKSKQSDLTPSSNFIESNGNTISHDVDMVSLWNQNPKAAANKFAETARKLYQR